MLVYFRNPDRSASASESRFWTRGGGGLHADVVVTASGYNSTAGWTASSPDGYGVKFPRRINDNRRFAIGCRLKVGTMPGAAKLVLAVTDDAGDIQCGISVNGDGTITIWRGDMDVALTTSDDVLDDDVWYRLGFKGSLDHSDGSLEVYVDGEVFVRVNDVDTAGQASNEWRGVYAGFSDDWTMGHLYAVDGSGSQTGLIHGALVKNRHPSETGLSGGTPIGAASLHAAVDDTVPDDDTSHIELPIVAGLEYSLGMEDLAASTAIYGVQHSVMISGVAGGGLDNHELIAVVDGSVHVDDWQSITTDEYKVITRLWETNPETGDAWTDGEINATDWGGRPQI